MQIFLTDPKTRVKIAKLQEPQTYQSHMLSRGLWFAKVIAWTVRFWTVLISHMFAAKLLHGEKGKCVPGRMTATIMLLCCTSF